MPERGLLQQIDDALTSTVPHGIVRLWLWIRVTNRGNVSHQELRGQFSDATELLRGALSRGLVSVTKTEVRASEWPERDSAGENREVAPESEDGRFRPLSRKLEVRTPPKSAECSDLADRGGTTRRRRKGDAPVGSRVAELEGVARVRYAFDHPRSPACQEIIREATGRMGRAYAKAYKEHTGREFWSTLINKNAAYFRTMVEFCVRNELRYDEWVRWCRDAYRKRSHHKKFPQPSNCAGPWVMGEWESDNSATENRHAGHSYRGASKGIRDTLTRAGFDVSEHDDDMLEHIESLARDKKNTPELYNPESDDLERIVDWLVHNTTGES